MRVGPYHRLDQLFVFGSEPKGLSGTEYVIVRKQGEIVIQSPSSA
jgi:hypothetical protein